MPDYVLRYLLIALMEVFDIFCMQYNFEGIN